VVVRYSNDPRTANKHCHQVIKELSGRARVEQTDTAARIEKALDVCQLYEKKCLATGNKERADAAGGGATSAAYVDHVMATVAAPDLDTKWQSYQKK
jgi:hypothetical protein